MEYFLRVIYANIEMHTNQDANSVNFCHLYNNKK